MYSGLDISCKCKAHQSFLDPFFQFCPRPPPPHILVPAGAKRLVFYPRSIKRKEILKIAQKIRLRATKMPKSHFLALTFYNFEAIYGNKGVKFGESVCFCIRTRMKWTDDLKLLIYLLKGNFFILMYLILSILRGGGAIRSLPIHFFNNSKSNQDNLFIFSDF